MKSKHVKNLVSVAAAGKLSLSVSTAFAQSCPAPVSLKVDDSDLFITATHQVVSGSNSGSSDTSKLSRAPRALGKADDTSSGASSSNRVREQTREATLYSRALSDSSVMRIEVQGVSRDKDNLQMFLLLAKERDTADSWTVYCDNTTIGLDPNSLEVIEILEIPKFTQAEDAIPTKLGTSELSESVGITSDVAAFDISFGSQGFGNFANGDRIYLQAMVTVVSGDTTAGSTYSTASELTELIFNFDDVPKEDSNAGSGGGGFGRGKVITS